MLSGVGDPAELKKFGIATVANLRGVGQNLQDHVLLSGVVYQYKGKMPERPTDSDAVEAEVFLSSGLSKHPADITLVFEQLPIATPEAAARFAAAPKEGFTIAPALVQPTSRGRVRLASANWRDAPIIEANHLGTDHDLKAIVKAIRQPANSGVRLPSTVSARRRSFRVRRRSAGRTYRLGTDRLGQLRPCGGHREDRHRCGCGG